MKAIIATIVSATLCLWAYAQAPDLHDSNVRAICSYVRTLRDQPEKYVEVRNAMLRNNAWTMMSEVADSCTADSRSSLCSLRDKVDRTEINDIAFQVEQQRGSLPVSTETFCNGNDPRYNYSFHEFKIKAGCSISTRIAGGSRTDNVGRTGPQLFLIIPFHEGAISAEILYNGNVVPCEVTEEGHLLFLIEEDVNQDDRIDITINNCSTCHQSAVIINHNSRRH